MIRAAYVCYEQEHSIIINDKNNMLFYSFDYDTRSSTINMDFQHYHPFYEIMIPLDENIVHYINGVPYHLKINDLVLLKPSILHKTEYPKGDPCKRIIISFIYPPSLFHMKQGFAPLLNLFDSKVPIYRFNKADQELLFGAFNEIYKLSKNYHTKDMALYELILHTKFIDFMYTLLTLHKNNLYTPIKATDELTEKIYKICAYIHTNYTQDISLDSISHQFFISRYYLSHQFKKITGFTLIHYIQLTRIKRAQYLLTTTPNKISEIALTCGFESFSQFNRTFHKFNNCSPSDFRKVSRSLFTP